MNKYVVTLRYYPGDPLEEIRESDLKDLEKQYGVSISYEKIENRVMKDGLLIERTIDKHIEDISQETIIVSSDNQDSLSNCILSLYRKYRSPRTPYSLIGSNEAGQKIAKRLMKAHSGW